MRAVGGPGLTEEALFGLELSAGRIRLWRRYELLLAGLDVMGGEVPQEYFSLWNNDPKAAEAEHQLYQSRLNWARETYRQEQREARPCP